MGDLNFGFGSGGSSSGVQSVVGTAMEIDVDNTDPLNPVVSLAVQVTGALAAALMAAQPGDNVSIFTNDSGYITAASLPAGANPSASLGLAAVNGVAGTFMRSDGAPALDVGIVPTWTGTHTWQSTQVDLRYNESDQAAGSQSWRNRINNGATIFAATSDDFTSSAAEWLRVTRANVAIASMALGNATDNPSISFNGADVLTSLFSGTYVGAVTGMTTDPAPTISFARFGKLVMLKIPAFSGTSNAVTFTVTGAPAAIRPGAESGNCHVRGINSGSAQSGANVSMSTGGVLTFKRASAANDWTNSGTKGLDLDASICYFI